MKSAVRMAVAVIAFVSFAWLESHAAPPPPRVRGSAPCRPEPKPKNVPQNKHVYVIAHDFNKDRVVDIRDTLIWMERNKNGYTSVLVNKDNAGLFEIVDIDRDGTVSRDEFVRFFRIYDTNNNNILDAMEIDNAKARGDR